jgi:hypothetical protein
MEDKCVMEKVKCKTCGRKLRGEMSKARGIGPTCWAKLEDWERNELAGQERLPTLEKQNVG